MTEPTPPDGHQPAEPPRFPERSARSDFTGEPDTPDAAPGSAQGDDTPRRVERPAAAPDVNDQGDTQSAPPRAGADPAPPPADPTTVLNSGGAHPRGGPNQPPDQPPSGPPSGPPGYVPAADVPPSGPPGYVPAADVPPSYSPGAPGAPVGSPGPGPSGPGYGGPPPGAFAGGAAPPPGGPTKKNGALIAGLVALGVALIGGLVFAVTQLGDDGDANPPPRTDEETEETEPDGTEPTSTVAATTLPPADGSVQDLFVRIEPQPVLVAEADIKSTLEEIGLSDGNNPVSTTDDVLNLCAAIPLDAPVSASVEWLRDNVAVSQGASRRLEAPADGNCINNSGEPLSAGSYEVSFTDDSGAETSVALFTIGAETRTQSFVNDTGTDVCSVDVGPSAAGFFQPFEVDSGGPLADGDSILIELADVEHEARALDCDDVALDSFFFTPTDDEINLTDGSVVVPVPESTTTTTAAPRPEITDLELIALDGEVGSLDIPIASQAEEDAVIDVLLSSEERLRLATTDSSLALCVAWAVDGGLAADIVWEFNRIEVARIPVEAVDGRVGACVPPGGAAFDEGAYQAYLERDEITSTIETFTVGRNETQLGFRNDTGVEVCEVGFSPNLTNFYTFYSFGDSTDFEDSLAPDETFTIVAPFIENDIKALDCDGNEVSEAFDIPPTDQTLRLTTGRP